jgi:hypothetical protein
MDLTAAAPCRGPRIADLAVFLAGLLRLDAELLAKYVVALQAGGLLSRGTAGRGGVGAATVQLGDAGTLLAALLATDQPYISLRAVDHLSSLTCEPTGDFEFFGSVLDFLTATIDGCGSVPESAHSISSIEFNGSTVLLHWPDRDPVIFRNSENAVPEYPRTLQRITRLSGEVLSALARFVRREPVNPRPGYHSIETARKRIDAAPMMGGS